MTWRLHTSVLAAGAAALISAQSLSAAPMPSSYSMDPLVSLSALGSAQSRAAVCAAGTTAATMAGTAAAQAAPVGCVLPITGAAPPPVAQTVAPPALVPARAPGKQIGMLPILGGLALLAAIAAFVLLDDDDDEGELEPISPQ